MPEQDNFVEIAKVLGFEGFNITDKNGRIASKDAGLPLPISLDIGKVQEWAELFTPKAELFKSVGMPPSMQPFMRLTTMPDQSFNGIMQWPGVLPSTLKKIGTEHIAPQMIIRQRIGDVLQYSKLSRHFWRPGWCVEMRAATNHPSSSDLKKIREAETFLYNCNIEYTNARDRDSKRLRSFPQFLAAIVRGFLMYDTMCIWTDTAVNGTIKAFAALDPAIIRLINPEVGYDGNKNIYAVGMNEAMQVNQKFTRDELIWYVGNPRLDIDTYGYGYSCLEVAARIIEAFSNAMELNMDTFNKNAIPPGILKLKGNFTQKQLDFINRLWTNIKKGASKNWVFPVMKVPSDGDVEILDLSRLKGNEAYYKEFMNLLMGVLCAVFEFPVHRLGYKASGTERDEKPEDLPNWIDEQDVGKIVLLGHLETVINEYILWPAYPDLQFTFTGKSPKEDAREYDTRTKSMTFNERRALVDLPPMEEIDIDSADLEENEKKQLHLVATAMGLCPVDTGLTGAFQSIISALIKSNLSGGVDQPGAKFPGQADPVESAKHSHIPSVRRDSAKETGKKP